MREKILTNKQNSIMRMGISKFLGLCVLLLAQQPLLAQAGDGSGSGYLVYGILAAAVLIFFVLVIQVSDSLLAIEAKQMGAERQGNFSIFPSVNELVPKKLPEHVADGEVTVLKRGHDILLEGEIEDNEVRAGQVTAFAVQPANFIGLMPIPKMLVEEGDEVKAGDPIFYDKKFPDIKFVAPVSGEIAEIKRGAKRAITEVVILADKEIKYRDYEVFDLDRRTREDLVHFLLESGVWPMFRQRPFDLIADPEATPRDIFVSTFDTAPLAPDLNVVVEGKGEAFQKGIEVLNKLTDGEVHLGLDARENHQPSPVFIGAEGVRKHWFMGKHPAGNVGIQIHHIAPIRAGDTVWTLGVQEVITLGKLFTEQKFEAERTMAVVGAELKPPHYVKTHLGAKIGDLVKDNLVNDHVRLISGDVLSGSRKEEDQFLDFFDDQLTVVEEGDHYEMFGWLVPSKLRPSISKTYPNFLFPDLRFRANTNTHGEKRAFVVTGEYERVLPMDIYPQELMKAILVNDFELMEGLGIHELIEEDIALCEFACTSKQPLQEILRRGLDTVREQS